MRAWVIAVITLCVAATAFSDIHVGDARTIAPPPILPVAATVRAAASDGSTFLVVWTVVASSNVYASTITFSGLLLDTQTIKTNRSSAIDDVAVTAAPAGGYFIAVAAGSTADIFRLTADRPPQLVRTEFAGAGAGVDMACGRKACIVVNVFDRFVIATVSDDILSSWLPQVVIAERKLYESVSFAVASNGEDFLVATAERDRVGFTVVSAKGTAAPARFIASRTPLHLRVASNGHTFGAVWNRFVDGPDSAEISADGEVIRTGPVTTYRDFASVRPHTAFVWAGDRYALVFEDRELVPRILPFDEHMNALALPSRLIGGIDVAAMPVIAAADRRVLVAWSAGKETNDGVRFAIHDVDGVVSAPVEERFLVSKRTAGQDLVAAFSVADRYMVALREEHSQEIVIHPIDAAGQPGREFIWTVPNWPPPQPIAIASNTFATLGFAGNRPALVRFSKDGTRLDTIPIGHPNGSRVLAASNGEEYLTVWEESFARPGDDCPPTSVTPGDSAVWMQRIRGDGSADAPRQISFGTGGPFASARSPQHVIWTGSEYLVFVAHVAAKPPCYACVCDTDLTLEVITVSADASISSEPTVLGPLLSWLFVDMFSDEAGNVLLLSKDSTSLRARFMRHGVPDPGGSFLIGPVYAYSDVTAIWQEGRFLICWTPSYRTTQIAEVFLDRRVIASPKFATDGARLIGGHGLPPLLVWERGDAHTVVYAPVLID